MWDLFGKYHSVSLQDIVVPLNDQVMRKKDSKLVREEMMSPGIKACPCI